MASQIQGSGYFSGVRSDLKTTPLEVLNLEALSVGLALQRRLQYLPQSIKIMSISLRSSGAAASVLSLRGLSLRRKVISQKTVFLLI